MNIMEYEKWLQEITFVAWIQTKPGEKSDDEDVADDGNDSNESDDEESESGDENNDVW